jgi:GT2 family glycosyltransferase
MDCVHVLLPVHNRREVTLKFVRCLREQTYPSIRLLLIDDGSTDGTEAAVRAAYPAVEIIRGSGSWWWAGCLQRGLDRLAREGTNGSDIVLFANDDTTFARDYVERAVQYLAGKQGCMLLSRYLDATTGRVEESGVCADLRTLTFQEARDPGTINCLSTRGLFVRWADLKRVGGFHPVLLPHYLSDYEFTIRAMRKGLTCAATSEVWLIADHSLTGQRDVDSMAGWTFVRTLLSVRYAGNPVYMSSFVLLAVPLRWVFPNLLRIWRDAMIQLVRRGLLQQMARTS